MGVSPYVRLSPDRIEEDIEAQLDDDFAMLDASEISLVIDYPLRTPSHVELTADDGVTFKYHNSYDSEDDEFDVDPGPTFKQGIKIARRMAKDDKKIKRSIATIAKWKTERIDARRDYKEFQAKLRPLEDKLEEQAEKHSKKLSKKTPLTSNTPT